MTPDPTRVDALEAEIARLRDLDLPGLQARWKALTRRKARQCRLWSKFGGPTLSLNICLSCAEWTNA